MQFTSIINTVYVTIQNVSELFRIYCQLIELTMEVLKYT